MQVFISLLFILFLIFLIIGLIRPSIITKVKKDPNRKDALIWIGIPTIMTLILSVILAPPIDYYEQGESEYKKGDYEDAYSYYLKVKQSNKNYSNAVAKATKVKFIIDSLALIETKKERLKKQQKLAEEKAKSETEKVKKKQEEVHKENQLTITTSESRKDKIDNQFSKWDGSHIKLEKYIKDNMNDPDSYEYVETKFWDMNDHLIVLTKYRGTNSFGGKVLSFVKVKVDLDGNILEIIQ